ncbi:Universal stress protein/MSMEI_3859 [Methylophilaceae bacterium]|nr:Universal stress protein/MSMEI_3859 [Methylophilaceae bacterium]
MTKLNRILAATDLSAPSYQAIERAAMICKETGASLDLIRVIKASPMEKFRQLIKQGSGKVKPPAHDTSPEKLDELAGTLRERHNVPACTHVAAGNVFSELTRKINEVEPDLVVLGARGERFMRHLLLGSTAERILNHAKYPILVVKQSAHQPYCRILVPVDFSEFSLRAARNARLLAPYAEIVLLHAFEISHEKSLKNASDEKTINHHRMLAENEATDKLRAFSQDAGLSSTHPRLLVEHGDPSLKILEQSEALGCDLIVMGRHGKSRLEALLLGSVTKHVLAIAQCDTLVSL